MDTSKEYIAMCEKAVEIQDVYQEDSQAPIWDIFYDKVSNKILENHKMKSGYVWLPRQDQLQEMVWEDGKAKENTKFYQKGEQMIELMFHNYVMRLNNAYETFEKLWLAFVMKEKYNKTWDGQGWIIP